MNRKRHLMVIAFYLGLAVLALFWPLLHTATHVGGTWTTDYYHFNWNFWWMRHALTTPGLNVYETNFVLFPFTTNLAYHTLTPFWYPLWAITEPLIGTLASMNLIYVVSMTLTGYFTFLFLRRENVSVGLALAGGALLQLTPTMFMSIMVAQINYVALFWYPLQLLLWGQVARFADKGWRGVAWTVVQGLAFYAMMMTDYQHILFLSFLLVPYGLLTLFRAKTTKARLRLIGLGVLALGLMAILLWFIGPLPYILSFDRSGLSPMSIDKADGIPFPNGYFSRFGTWEREISLGVIILPALLLALFISLTLLRKRIHNPIRWFWLALGIIPLLLSFGPSLPIGDTTIATPYVPFHNLFGGLFRSPARFAPILIFPGLIFIGQTLTPLLAKNRMLRLWLSSGVMLLVLGDVFLYPLMPLQPPVTTYTFYEKMGQEQGAPYDDYVVVEVPVAGGSGEAWVAGGSAASGEGGFKPMETQFNGMTHHKRMLNGSIARAPLSNFWYWLYDDPMLAWLGQRRFLEPENVQAQLEDRIFNWPIGYIVVHQDLIGKIGPTNQEIIGYFNSLPDLLCPAYVEGDAVVFRTAWHPDGCSPRTPPETQSGVYRIDMGDSGDERYIGRGWYWQEDVPGLRVRWAGAYPEALVYVDLPPESYTLSLATQSFNQDRELEILVNGISVGTKTVQVARLQTLEYDLPAEVIGDGHHVTVTLAYKSADAPADIGVGGDTRTLSVMVDWIQFAVDS
jgi:hypothetical protein